MPLEYKKRPGTSGIAGQLYETKLISLVLFRLLHDDNIEDFCLGSNLDDIGAFDDICFKIKIKNRDRPVIGFVQVKHKDNTDKCLSLDNKSDAVKWSESILHIKKNYAAIDSTATEHAIFDKSIDQTDFLFLLYTNANCDFALMKDNQPQVYESDFATTLNDIMATNGKVGLQSSYKKAAALSDNILEAHMCILAQQFSDVLFDKTENILKDENIYQHHVILRKNVVNVTDIQTDKLKPDAKYRVMTFRPDFFETTDKYFTVFRDHLYEQIIKKLPKIEQSTANTTKQSPDQASTTSAPSTEQLISDFLSNPSALTLSPLIVTHITCNVNGKLVFIRERSKNDIKRLGEIKISMSTINEAKLIAAKNKLMAFKVKVPYDFGNIDLAINGSDKKIDRRLIHLTKAIINFCQNYTESESYKIVTIDDTIDAGILNSNGGLASAVGNILVEDGKTKYLKFTSDDTSLQKISKALYDQLKCKLDNLHKYRFDVKTSRFPKLSLEYTDVASEFLSKLVLYANQKNHHEIDKMLQEEIQRHPSTTLNNISDKSDVVLLYYHNQIQKWWMSLEVGSYLTKASTIYTDTILSIEAEPQISRFKNMFHINNVTYFEYTFSEDAMKSFECLETFTKMAIVTDITTLTVLKVMKRLENLTLRYVVLYLDNILKLPTEEFSALGAELEKTENVVVIVCDISEYNVFSHIKLMELEKATKEKKVVVVTNDVYIEAVKLIFSCPAHVLYDKSQNLSDMTEATQHKVINKYQLMFQGSKVALNWFVDSSDMSSKLIKGPVLDKIIRNQTISIGAPLSNQHYDEIKHLYVDRRVTQVSYDADDATSAKNTNTYRTMYKLVTRHRVVKTFHDISDDAVLITAAAGMGKSILLTHLALETKKRDENVSWIIRINLLDYSKEFFIWQKDKIEFNTLETLKFLCQIVVKNNNLSINLKETNDDVFLESCTGDEWATFELNMFLRFYNKKRLILLFDGFDEICPHYKDSVIKVLNVVRNFPQKNKMWVTSRPYSDILPDLRNVLGKYFKIENLSDAEQETYLQNTWRAKLNINKLSDVQLNNLLSFIKMIPHLFTGKNYSNSRLEIDFYRIYAYFYTYALSNLSNDIRTSITQFPIHTDLFVVTYSEPHKAETVDKLVPKFYRQCSLSKDPDALLGTPLLLYFIADYFVNIVNSNCQDVNEWQSDMNVFKIYEMFINNKIQKIRFEEKNKMDVHNPDIRIKYEKERADCLSMHKKLAAYDLFKSPIFRKLKCGEFDGIDPLSKEEFDDIIYKIKTGEEKTGLVSHVNVHDVPVFIHKTFTEYFVAEFLCDKLKCPKFGLDNQQLLYTTIYLFGIQDLLPWIVGKCKIDNDLAKVINRVHDKRPLFLTWYLKLFYDWRGSDILSHEQFIRMMNSSEEDYEIGCFDKYNENILTTDDINNELFSSYHICDEIKTYLVSKMKPNLKKHFELNMEQARKVSVLTEDIWFRRDSADGDNK